MAKLFRKAAISIFHSIRVVQVKWLSASYKLFFKGQVAVIQIDLATLIPVE